MIVTAVTKGLDMTNLSKRAPSPPPGGTWTLAGAKARLSEVVERAQAGPQTITRHGKNAVVVVSAAEWERKTKRKGTFAEFLWNSPLRGSGLVIERVNDEPRKIDL